MRINEDFNDQAKSYILFRDVLDIHFGIADKLPKRIGPSSVATIRLVGETKDPNTKYKYDQVIFQCGVSSNASFVYEDRNGLRSWREIKTLKRLDECVVLIKSKYKSEGIILEISIREDKFKIK